MHIHNVTGCNRNINKSKWCRDASVLGVKTTKKNKQKKTINSFIAAWHEGFYQTSRNPFKKKEKKTLLWKFYIIKTVILDIINTVFY